jgi:hypothetical protein
MLKRHGRPPEAAIVFGCHSSARAACHDRDAYFGAAVASALFFAFAFAALRQ